MSTIGIGGSHAFSSITAWLAMWATGGYVGDCYFNGTSDGEFTSANETFPITFNQHAGGSSADFTTLRAATGQGYKDNIGSGALRYNASNGVAIRSTAYNTGVFSIPASTGSDYVTIQGLQIACTGGGGALFAIDNALVAGTHNGLSGCIVESNPGSSSNAVMTWRTGGGGGVGGMINDVVVNRASTGDGIRLVYPSGAVFANITVVRPSDLTAAGSAFNLITGSGTATIVNCAGFGFGAFQAVAGGTLSGSNNASDKTISFGSNNQASKTYANQFVNTLDSTRDFTPKLSGTDLVHGLVDTTDVPSGLDCIGVTRGGSIWYIGARELAAAGGTPKNLTTLGAGLLAPIGLSALKRDFGPIRRLLKS